VYRITVNGWSGSVLEIRKVNHGADVPREIAQFVTQYSGCKSIVVSWEETILYSVDGYGKPILLN
jgi:hypothetical protein